MTRTLIIWEIFLRSASRTIVCTHITHCLLHFVVTLCIFGRSLIAFIPIIMLLLWHFWMLQIHKHHITSDTKQQKKIHNFRSSLRRILSCRTITLYSTFPCLVFALLCPFSVHTHTHNFSHSLCFLFNMSLSLLVRLCSRLRPQPSLVSDHFSLSFRSLAHLTTHTHGYVRLWYTWLRCVFCIICNVCLAAWLYYSSLLTELSTRTARCSNQWHSNGK